MTTSAEILPNMHELTKRTVYILICPGFEIMDLAGPASVFTAANHWHPGAYQLRYLSSTGGPVMSAAQAPIVTESITDYQIDQDNILLVSGLSQTALQAALDDKTLISWLSQAPTRFARYGSVCAGAFLLAKAGLLANRKATTHWAGIDLLKDLSPTTRIEADALYVEDGALWTSAGVTTGLDMALEIVARDLGRDIKGEIAKYLVVYAHRPGNQAQFSTVLESQIKASGDFEEIVLWLENNLQNPVPVADMAARMGMSERSFHRHFTARFDMTPAKLLEKLRIERAKKLLEQGEPAPSVAAGVGFKSFSGFRTAFEKNVGISAALHQKLHQK